MILAVCKEVTEMSYYEVSPEEAIALDTGAISLESFLYEGFREAQSTEVRNEEVQWSRLDPSS